LAAVAHEEGMAHAAIFNQEIAAFHAQHDAMI
jgi:hypothetical protein